MASPTKIIETIRARKRNKLLTARTKKVRLQANKKAAKAPEALRRFIAGASKVAVKKASTKK